MLRLCFTTRNYNTGTVAFWESLEDEAAGVPSVEGIIIGDGLNRYIETNRDGFVTVKGPYGYGIANKEGEKILDCFKN